MKYTILLLLAFVMGCTAQRAMYSPDRYPVFPVRFTLPRYPHSAGRFPNTQTVGDQFQCEKELQKMSQQLTDTNDAIENLKKQLKVENEQLKKELADMKKNSGGNVQVSEFKKQLDETTVTVDTSTSEILKKELNAENEQIRKELEDLKKTVNENMEETKFKFVAMDERLFATEINLTESSQKLAFMELAVVGQSQVQESLSLSVDQLSKDYTTKYEGMLNQMAADTNQLYFDLQSRLKETDMTLKETVNKFEELTTKFEAFFAEIQTGKNSGKIDLVSGKLGERNSAIENLRTDFEETKQNLADTNSALKILQEDFRVRGLPKSIGKMPTSCADLKQIGYLKSGVYSVMGGKNVLNVYCDFTVDDKKMEKLIGPPSN
ncbi:restin homolog [Daphnia pulicaria]|uniref:restin homolog n=1 Tax=Daphnia pulicaria TaxID=35523 RepID=UPI001EE9EEB6|nr:restin homolog [Daphnia pulicaria]